MLSRPIAILAVVLILAVGTRAIAQDGTESAVESELQVVVLEPTEVYSTTDELLWTAEPGEAYTVVSVEGDMALVVADDETGELAWVGLDSRVELVPQMAEEGVPEMTATPTPTQTPLTVTATLTPTPTAVATATLAPGTPGGPTQTPGGPTQAPGVTATSVPGARNPASWSLTVADLPGFTLVPSDQQPPAYGAVFSNTRASINEPIVVFNLLFPSPPAAPPFSQAFIEPLTDAVGQALAEGFGGGTATPVSGPPVGDVRSWLRATATQTSGAITVRTEMNMVGFAVRSDFAIVGTVHLEGSGSQGEAARLANIVAERMRR